MTTERIFIVVPSLSTIHVVSLPRCRSSPFLRIQIAETVETRNPAISPYCYLQFLCTKAAQSKSTGSVRQQMDVRERWGRVAKGNERQTKRIENVHTVKVSNQSDRLYRRCMETRARAFTFTVYYMQTNVRNLRTFHTFDQIFSINILLIASQLRFI